MTDIETRLRQALSAKADGVTEAQLSVLPSPRSDGAQGDRADVLPFVSPLPPGSGRHARWLAPLLAASVVLILLIGVLVIRSSGDDRETPVAPVTHSPQPSYSAPTSAPVTPLPSTSAPTTSAAVTPLAHGEQAPRSAVPWASVGRGWTLATWTPKPADVTGQAEELFLLNPIGGRYLIDQLPPNTGLAAWSSDTFRALLTTGDKAAGVSEIDLRTGSTKTVSDAHANYGWIRYTEPKGLAYVITDDHGGTVRIGTDGVEQKRYPAPLTGGLYTPDGLRLVFQDGPGLAVLSNAGVIERKLAPPSGYGSCYADRWWSPGVLLATCATPDSQTRDLFLASIGGGSMHRLLGGRTAPLNTHLTVAWRLSDRTLLSPDTPCGISALFSEYRDGRIASTPPPRVLGTSPAVGVAAITGDEVRLVSGGCNGPLRSLVSWNPISGASSVLLGPGINGGSVVSVAVLSADE